MSFEWEKTKSGSGGNFKRTEFLKLTPGTHTVRIVQKVPKKYYQHWFGGGVECLGEECPQCAQNQRIIDDNNGDYDVAKKVEGFVKRDARGAVNVVDRTPIKICPECGAENRPTNNEFPSACWSCTTLITDVAPKVTNNVKVFSRAASVFDQLYDLDKHTLDKEGNVVGINNFDVSLYIVGNNCVPVPTENREVLEVDESKFYDLEKVALKLSAEEMTQRMKGVSIKEIFQARKPDGYKDASEDSVEISKEKVAEIQSEIKDIF